TGTADGQHAVGVVRKVDVAAIVGIEVAGEDGGVRRDAALRERALGAREPAIEGETAARLKGRVTGAAGGGGPIGSGRDPDLVNGGLYSRVVQGGAKFGEGVAPVAATSEASGVTSDVDRAHVVGGIGLAGVAEGSADQDSVGVGANRGRCAERLRV